jgi:hypothetical protein
VVFTLLYRRQFSQTQSNVVDARQYEGMIHVGRKTIHDIGKTLEELQKEVHLLATGFHKPHVLIQKIEDHRAKVEETIRTLEKETDQGSNA